VYNDPGRDLPTAKSKTRALLELKPGRHGGEIVMLREAKHGPGFDFAYDKSKVSLRESLSSEKYFPSKGDNFYEEFVNGYKYIAEKNGKSRIVDKVIIEYEKRPSKNDISDIARTPAEKYQNNNNNNN
jgi:hypothetical protein